MQPTQLELRGLHLPEAISWWPPAIGWWLVTLGVIASLVFLYWCYHRLTRKTAVKMAKITLVGIQQNSDWDNAQKLRELSILLRRVAISMNPRADVASLTGAAWLRFLDAPLLDSPFSSGIGTMLADAPYRQFSVSDAQLSELIKLCEHWLKHCARPVRSPSNQQEKTS
jgi:hypothetical protein